MRVRGSGPRHRSCRLRWFKDATDMRILARDAGVSIATGYRYPHEAIDVIAAQAPERPDVLAEGQRQDWAFVCLDGALIHSIRCSAPSETGHDLWYFGKHNTRGGNIQVVADPGGWPVWVSDVEPGSTHNITAARIHALPALYPAAAASMPTLTDKRGMPAPASASRSRSKETRYARTTRPTTGGSTPCAHPPNAPTPYSKTRGARCAASPSIPGEPEPSPPPPSSYPTFRNRAGEKPQ
jgi:hypothetical protein